MNYVWLYSILLGNIIYIESLLYTIYIMRIVDNRPTIVAVVCAKISWIVGEYSCQLSRLVQNVRLLDF